LRLVVVSRLDLDPLVPGLVLLSSSTPLPFLSRVVGFLLLCPDLILDGCAVLATGLNSTIPACAALFCHSAPPRNPKFIKPMHNHRTVDLWPQFLSCLTQNPCDLRLASPACSDISIFSFITDLNAKLGRAFIFWPCVGTAWKLANLDICSTAAGECERKNLTHHKFIPFELVAVNFRIFVASVRVY
jgi:hypothetical protein